MEKFEKHAQIALVAFILISFSFLISVFLMCEMMFEGQIRQDQTQNLEERD